ncbi:E3 ubiquitin-protein ligase APD2 [Camellia lanceoleosa]|uniref:E3 ubiquitin-protein ligase APD2 n=1 Tax=Camellia lanceoleosa TaxID=1840588 RepID=A0ACC0GFB4_9ERIC|nr:E3 ubiquitin-protein ligase APD2 [Camellia lanceoleosa]
MEEQDRSSSAQASSSSSSTGREFSGDAATSSSAFPVTEEAAAEEAEHRDLTRQQNGVSYHVHYPTEEAREISPLLREDAWSCMIVVFTFWFFVSMTLILGVYGSVSLQLGPNSSLLITPNTLFVESITVEQLDEAKNGPILYGFYKEPQADVELTWSQTHNTSLPSGFHKEWIYMLNRGSQINISYSVNSPSPSSIILIIAQGSEGFAQWLEDPSYPNTTLSWNIINGSGIIQQDILTSASYYVAVGNLNSEEVEVQLNLKVKAILYNTTEAYYNCAVACGMCNLKMLFPSGNAVVLTSPGPEQGTNVWQVQLSYGPRWLTYLVGIGGLTLLVLSAFYMFNNCQCTREEGTRFQFGEMRSERAPLLQKDDDLSSWGSSCDSVSQDDEDLEDELALGSLEGMPLKDGEYNNNIRRLCAICFDAPRDCFFLPCGHCVACFACGTRIAELTGTCPICRRNIKKVRRIFTV